MKRSLALHILIFSSVFAFGQDLSISISPTLNNLLYYLPVSGAAIRSTKVGFSSSFQYEFINEKKVSFGMGIGYQFSQVDISPAPMLEGDTHTETANLISASFIMMYKMRHQFYLSLDPLLDVQLGSNSPDAIENQTGLGLSFAVGKKIFLKDSFYVRVEPRIWIHNIISFTNKNLPLKLTVVGVNIGVGLRK